MLQCCSFLSCRLFVVSRYIRLRPPHHDTPQRLNCPRSGYSGTRYPYTPKPMQGMSATRTPFDEVRSMMKSRFRTPSAGCRKRRKGGVFQYHPLRDVATIRYFITSSVIRRRTTPLKQGKGRDESSHPPGIIASDIIIRPHNRSCALFFD